MELESLLNAVEQNRTDVVRLIVSEYEAAKNKTILKTILESKCSPSGTLLHFATVAKQTDNIRTLLSAGSDVSLKNSENKTALDLADSNQCKIFEQEFLQNCAKSQHDRMLQFIQAGININCFDSETTKNTPLHYACLWGDFNAVKILYNNGADITIKNSDGKTAVDEAIKRGDANINQLFQKKIEKSESDFSSITEINSNGISSEHEKLSLLWPLPRMLIQNVNEPLKLTKVIDVFIAENSQNMNNVLQLWDDVAMSFTDLNIKVTTRIGKIINSNNSRILCEVNSTLFTRQSQSYKLSIETNLIKLVATDLIGLFYAISTLIQLFVLFDDGIPCLQLHDFPAFPERGILIDITTEPLVLDMLLNMIRNLGFLKINRLLLYFRFGKHDETLQLPYTALEFTELNKHCSKNFITIVPVIDVNSNVTYEDISLLHSDFSQFINLCSNAHIVHVGPRLTPLLVNIENNKLCMDDVQKYIPIGNRACSLCAFLFRDVKMEILQQIPPGIALAEYGFNTSYPFKQCFDNYLKTGVPFYVLNGTTAWNCCTTSMKSSVTHINKSLKQAYTHGSMGAVVCQWSGQRALTPSIFAWPGYLLLAGLAWNIETEKRVAENNLPLLLNQYVFEDTNDKIGQILKDLSDAESMIDTTVYGDNCQPPENGSVLFQLMLHPDLIDIEKISLDLLNKTFKKLRFAENALQNVNLECPRKELIIRQTQFAHDSILAVCRLAKCLMISGKKPANGSGCSVVNCGIANLSPTMKTDLANRFLTLKQNFMDIWKENCSKNETICIFNEIVQLLLPTNNNSLSVV